MFMFNKSLMPLKIIFQNTYLDNPTQYLTVSKFYPDQMGVDLNFLPALLRENKYFYTAV